MIRRPTPHDILYRWHSEAVKGVYGDIKGVDPTPECGWYKRRLVKGGIFVPARIWMEQTVDDAGELVEDERLMCEVNGNYCDADEEWLHLANHPITEAEYTYMHALRRHVAWHEPDHPAANPRQPVNWRTAPIPTFTTDRR